MSILYVVLIVLLILALTGPVRGRFGQGRGYYDPLVVILIIVLLFLALGGGHYFYVR